MYNMNANLKVQMKNDVSDNDTNSTASDNRIIDITEFNSKERCYYKMIHKYFKSCENNEVDKMISILNKESDTSLRILDWFVTKYSSKNNVCYKLPESGLDFNVHISYKAQLKSYKKKYFDPFRRRQKFYYKYKDDCEILTTIGQLNFFRWCFSNNIIKYVEKNVDNITKGMNKSNKVDKEKKIVKKISNKYNKKLLKTCDFMKNTSIVLKFD